MTIADTLEASVRAREEALGDVERLAAVRVMAEVEREGRHARAAFTVHEVVAVAFGIQVDEVAMQGVPPAPVAAA